MQRKSKGMMKTDESGNRRATSSQQKGSDGLIGCQKGKPGRNQNKIKSEAGHARSTKMFCLVEAKPAGRAPGVNWHACWYQEESKRT
jgi:hypothetical protein